MSRIDLVGYLASGLVLCTFCMRAMVPLRLMAIGSNIGFILYGHLAEIEPVLLLHLLLLPMNLWRLGESLAQSPVREARRMGPHSVRMTWESRQGPSGASCAEAEARWSGEIASRPIHVGIMPEFAAGVQAANGTLITFR